MYMLRWPMPFLPSRSTAKMKKHTRYASYTGASSGIGRATVTLLAEKGENPAVFSSEGSWVFKIGCSR